MHERAPSWRAPARRVAPPSAYRGTPTSCGAYISQSFMAHSNDVFVADLETCIRSNAHEIARTAMEWSDRCAPAKYLSDHAKHQLNAALEPIRQNHGYAAALWCAFYTAKMTDLPFYGQWRDKLLCPWPEDWNCRDEPLGKHGDEAKGVPAAWGPTMQGAVDNDLNRGDPVDGLVAMSCGLCGHLERTFGKAPFIEVASYPSEYQTSSRLKRMRSEGWFAGHQGWWNEFDNHAFGAWVANDMAAHSRDVEETVLGIHLHRITNGEEIHGFVGEAIRQLSGTQIDHVHYAARLCTPSQKFSGMTQWSCRHAIGHGFFSYRLEDLEAGRSALDGRTVVNQALGDCITLATFFGEWGDTCAAGVSHAATNALTVGGLRAIAAVGQDAKSLVCRSATESWHGEPHYDECHCISKLGLEDADVRWRLVRDGLCEPAQTGPKPWQHASTWEFQQLRQVPEAFVRLAVETADLRCYVERYRDLFDGYCRSSFSECAWAELRWHWEVSGKKEGRQLACQPSSPKLPPPALPPPPVPVPEPPQLLLPPSQHLQSLLPVEHVAPPPVDPPSAVRPEQTVLLGVFLLVGIVLGGALVTRRWAYASSQVARREASKAYSPVSCRNETSRRGVCRHGAVPGKTGKKKAVRASPSAEGDDTVIL